MAREARQNRYELQCLKRVSDIIVLDITFHDIDCYITRELFRK